MTGMDPNFIERVKYMTAEITKTATSVNADVGYIKNKIKPADLAKCDLLFIHLPSLKYDADEAKAINQYVQKGGNLFLVMDVDYWSTLEQTNVNAIVSPSGITFGTDSPDTLTGGYTKPSPITNKKLKVTYHGGRIVNGGTPFCYNNDSNPFGIFATSGKGKMVVMGDGMVSLYMTSWKGVNDYQCSEFMHEVFAWLTKVAVSFQSDDTILRPTLPDAEMFACRNSTSASLCSLRIFPPHRTIHVRLISYRSFTPIF